jgi:predicted Fe-S protein YdhL (DUF1289 family)
MTMDDRRSGRWRAIPLPSEDPDASPCVRRCTLDERDLCIGCGRTLDEILEWSAAPTRRKVQIRSEAIARLQDRRFHR